MATHRFEICYTLACSLTLLRPEEALLLEDETRADEKAAGNCENDADDLSRERIRAARCRRGEVDLP